MINRLQQIKEKGFSMAAPPLDFNKVKIGVKTLDDAVLSLGDYKSLNTQLADKKFVLNAISKYDLETMREISNFFYKTSGIYSRLCRYMAFLYRYDWMITPYIIDDSAPEDKILRNFSKTLSYMDNCNIKKILGEIALKVITNGCYYGYIVETASGFSLQELPIRYCRTRYTVNGFSAIEFNMKFFDEYFRDAEQRAKVLNLFPKEFKKGYILYKQGKLVPDYQGDTKGWYLLEIGKVIKFNVNGEDFPMFINVVPAIIDLDAAQDLDRKKMAQQLLKIIIQKMPFDKNGDLIFDVDEARELHNNAVQMLGRAIGIDVLTTFADVDVADMADRNTTTSVDELEKVERTVYNESGTAQNLFNTDGNIALEKSILNDEAAIYNLLLQFEAFLNNILKQFDINKKVTYKLQLLNTTIYNYKELSKMYKEQAQLGYSKMLPQIALGQSQSSILANAYFENNILDLVSMFVPPITSNQMSPSAIQRDNSSDNKVGRKEKPDDEKSEKTIANRESMN